MKMITALTALMAFSGLSSATTVDPTVKVEITINQDIQVGDKRDNNSFYFSTIDLGYDCSLTVGSGTAGQVLKAGTVLVGDVTDNQIRFANYDRASWTVGQWIQSSVTVTQLLFINPNSAENDPRYGQPLGAVMVDARCTEGEPFFDLLSGTVTLSRFGAWERGVVPLSGLRKLVSPYVTYRETKASGKVK